MAQGTPFRLLITDFRMPEMNGLRLIGAARALMPQLGTILITGYGSEGLREEAEGKEVSVYLEKPFSPGTLARHASQVLEQRTGRARSGPGTGSIHHPE